MLNVAPVAGAVVDFPLSSLSRSALGFNCSFLKVEVVIETFLIFFLIMFISTVPVKEQHVPSLSSISPQLITLCWFGSFGEGDSSFGSGCWYNRQTSACST